MSQLLIAFVFVVMVRAVFSVSGQGRYRNLWEHYYAEAEGIIFVIDSAEAVRMCVVKDELDTLLAHKGQESMRKRARRDELAQRRNDCRQLRRCEGPETRVEQRSSLATHRKVPAGLLMAVLFSVSFCTVYIRSFAPSLALPLPMPLPLPPPDISKRAIPILFFANKSDLPKALTPAQISEALELNKLTDRDWNIVASNALNGTGLEPGVKWLSSHLPQ
jgi:hypothetical protein